MTPKPDYPFFAPQSSEYSLSPSSLIPDRKSEETSLDLAWLFSVFRRRLWIMALVAGTLAIASGGLIVIESEKEEEAFKGSFQVLVEPVSVEGRLARLSLLAQSGTHATTATDLSREGAGRADLLDYETQMRVLKSPKILEPLVEKIKVEYPDITIGDVVSNLALQRITYEKDGKFEGTKILEVIYGDADPDKILFILKQVQEAYLEYSLEERLNTLNKGIEHIDGQLPTLEERVDGLQRELQQLRERYQVNYPEETARDLSTQARTLSTQRINTQAQLEEAKANYANLKKQLDSGNPLPIFLSSIQTQQAYGVLIAQLQTVEAKIATESAQFKEESPRMQVLRERQANLKQTLIQEAKKVLSSVDVRIRDLEAQVDYIQTTERELQNRLDTFPRVLRTYTDLERELSVASESLKTFLEKREGLQLDASQSDIPWMLIKEPDIWKFPNGAFMSFKGGNAKRQVAIAFILASLFGVGVGFIVEILHSVYHTPEEIKNATKLRLLGSIPTFKKLKRYEKKLEKLASKAGSLVVPSDFPTPNYSPVYLEAFRSLYTNIDLLGTSRSIVIGSATSGDGKSTIARQLAETAAAMDRRVLLVDADLRKPQLHLRLGLQNNLGLSDILQSDLSLNDVIQQFPLEENLFFLSAGQTIIDPVKLLSSAKMQHLSEQFQGFFDFVIYNVPPLVGLADGHILAAKSDGIILVVSLEKTNRGLLNKAIENLKISGASVLGFVANNVNNYVPVPYSLPRNRPSRFPRLGLPKNNQKG
ncbi:MAG: polysaccharide biosynthesis tyrosine autokinase [Cyanobacteria bacterium P01_E01_bin.42]